MSTVSGAMTTPTPSACTSATRFPGSCCAMRRTSDWASQMREGSTS